MNIQEAKREIEQSLRLYTQKDEDGCYSYPRVHQRPILLMGPPGIGKTAIVEQIARENQVALVSYTMTHHTRQSAIGLPKIVTATYQGRDYAMTEYTMSEIIASVYQAMEHSGCETGILFLDEINCVSDTLAPVMLQFLQNKTFGSHALPEGWIIVAAGNPPGYNKSVREFDIVTLDRVRTLSLMPDLNAFLEYGSSTGIHGAVSSYLSLYRNRFYHVDIQGKEPHYVTSRGWEDLSLLLQGYEKLHLPVTQDLIREFLHLEETARDFFSYYQMYIHYGEDYRIPELLQGTLTSEEVSHLSNLAAKGDLTERYALVGLLLAGLESSFRHYHKEDLDTLELHRILSKVISGNERLVSILEQSRKTLKTKEEHKLLSSEELHRQHRVLNLLDSWELDCRQKRLSDSSARNA
ncbi:MAG: AAA family ATPase, partial [Eubacteriales bacterium]|nr:AAA family ATPase [Eubacteriales bacterium]